MRGDESQSGHRVSEPGAMEVKGKGGESSGEQELSSLPLFLKVV